MGPHPPFIEYLAHSLGETASSKTIFGEPVVHEESKIIPVAKIQYGFGGGYEKKEANGMGKGGGGGIAVQPVGYIEMTKSQTTFKPIRIPSSMPFLIVGCAIASFFLLKGIRLFTEKRS
jgi:uncharacterized spore protein YtfJ